MRSQEHQVMPTRGCRACHLLTLRSAALRATAGLPRGLMRKPLFSRNPSDVSPAGVRQSESGAVEEFCTAESRFHGRRAWLGARAARRPLCRLAFSRRCYLPEAASATPACPGADFSKF